VILGEAKDQCTCSASPTALLGTERSRAKIPGHQPRENGPSLAQNHFSRQNPPSHSPAATHSYAPPETNCGQSSQRRPSQKTRHPHPVSPGSGTPQSHTATRATPAETVHPSRENANAAPTSSPCSPDARAHPRSSRDRQP